MSRVEIRFDVKGTPSEDAVQRLDKGWNQFSDGKIGLEELLRRDKEVNGYVKKRYFDVGKIARVVVLDYPVDNA